MEKLNEKTQSLQAKFLNEIRELDGYDNLKKKFDKEMSLLFANVPVQNRPDFPIKKINGLEKFTANGQEYIIRTSLTISRFEEFEKLQVSVGYGVEFKQLFQNIRKAYDVLQDRRDIDAGVILHNIMSGVKEKIEERENPVLKLCALYICTPDEDLSVYDEDLTKKKIEDWKAEQIDVNSFFSLAFNLVNEFTPIFKEVSQSISSHMESVQSEAKK